MNFIEKQKKLEKLAEQFSDSFGPIFSELKNEFAISSSREDSEALQKMENINRLLKIGIVGRVKSGKSSLLNALLFNGEEILPKAATPMTAALTILSYGENFEAEVEFYSESDIETIEKNAKKYEMEKKRIIENEISEFKEQIKLKNKNLLNEEIIRKRAIYKANEILKDNMILVSAYEHNKLLDKAKIPKNKLKNRNKITVESIDKLNRELKNYVSVEGKYSPFTKSVHIKIPNNILKNLEIVDTPGVNDPVKSREQRTRELLKECDVTFVISPAGQFMTKEDTELMDRITIKEGVSELFVIASQVDTQLMGSIKRESNGNLNIALDNIVNQLSEQLKRVLLNLKETNPEIKTMFDQLIDNNKGKIIFTGSVATSMINFWDNRLKWDSNMKKVWENLVKNYPDFFSDKDTNLSINSLDILANLDKIKGIISSVRNKKDKILGKRKKEFVEAKEKNVSKFINKIIEEIEKRIEEVKNTSVDNLISTQKNLKKIQKKASSVLDEEYELIISEFQQEIKKNLSATLNSYFKNTKSDIYSEESTITESYEYDKGVGFLFWRSIFGVRYETRYRTVTTVRAGAVLNILDNLTLEIEDAIKLKIDEIILKMRKETNRRLLSSIRKVVTDDYLEPYKIIKSLKNVFRVIDIPEFVYSGSIPENLQKYGTLRNEEAEEFISEAQAYVSSLQRRVHRDISAFIQELVRKLRDIELSKDFFGDLDNELKILKEQIEIKEMTIDTFNRVLKELKEVADNE